MSSDNFFPFYLYYPKTNHHRLLTEAVFPFIQSLRQTKIIKNSLFWQDSYKGDHLAVILNGIRPVGRAYFEDIIYREMGSYIKENPTCIEMNTYSSNTLFVDFPNNSIVFENYNRTDDDIKSILKHLNPNTENIMDTLVKLIINQNTLPLKDSHFIVFILLKEIFDVGLENSREKLDGFCEIVINDLNFDVESDLYIHLKSVSEKDVDVFRPNGATTIFSEMSEISELIRNFSTNFSSTEHDKLIFFRDAYFLISIVLGISVNETLKLLLYAKPAHSILD